MSNRVAHFEIHADDLERAKHFYQTVFGWDFQEWKGGDQEYWMIMTADKDSKEAGINGGLLQRLADCKPPEKGQAVTGYVCTIVVDDYDEAAKKILEAGGVEALPKYDLAGMAWQGYYLDTEKNVFGIHQMNPAFKK